MPRYTFTNVITDRNTGLSATRSADFTVQPAAPVFGFNYDIDGGFPAAAATLGVPSIPGSKFFNSSVPASYPGHPVPAGVTTELATIKITLTTSAPWISSADQAALGAVFASMPVTGRPAVTINQEGEGKRFGYSAAQLTGAHATALAIFRTRAPSNAVYCQNLMTFSATSGGRGTTFGSYLCCAANGQADLPLYLLDWYPSSSASGPAASIQPAIDGIRAKVPGAVIGVAECNYTETAGITYADGTSEPQAHWFRDAWNYAVSNGLTTFFCYFRNADAMPWPPDAATVSQLSAIAKSSSPAASMSAYEAGYQTDYPVSTT